MIKDPIVLYLREGQLWLMLLRTKVAVLLRGETKAALLLEAGAEVAVLIGGGT